MKGYVRCSEGGGCCSDGGVCCNERVCLLQRRGVCVAVKGCVCCSEGVCLLQ